MQGTGWRQIGDDGGTTFLQDGKNLEFRSDWEEFGKSIDICGEVAGVDEVQDGAEGGGIHGSEGNSGGGTFRWGGTAAVFFVEEGTAGGEDAAVGGEYLEK